MQKFVNHQATAILLPALLGLGGAALSVKGFEQYGWSLFLGLPFLVSFLSALLWCFKRQKPYWAAYRISSFSILSLGGLLIIFALDGLICLLMALPLALVIGLIGTAIGRAVGSSVGGGTSGLSTIILTVLFPALVGFENATGNHPTTRTVTTSVRIDAPIEEVWQAVIAFPKIETIPDGIFRLGIAYPIEASIEGEGVGAIRYCTFSTGNFVEPITIWDAPHHLAFDVTESPEPMKELSIYPHLHAPHLHGYMVSEKGQFKLTAQGDQVHLEGTTWYFHKISPEFYWSVISDAIIHKIHRRVLNHIKEHVEKN